MLKATSGPFEERPFYEDEEIETLVANELRGVDLLPSEPKPIRVDRFIEKRYGIVPQYEATPNGILGFTGFGNSGPEAVVVSRSLSEEGSRVAERRINSTLAHEAGHMLLHGRLFALQRRARTRALIEDDLDEKKQTILCRSSTVERSTESSGTDGYDGRWWEFQANMVIGALLLPRQLVQEALGPVLVSEGRLGVVSLGSAEREEAVHLLAEAFNVNQAVARIRIGGLFPAPPKGQLTL